MHNIILAQFIILLGGTIFAWCNFFMELSAWLKGKKCTTGCKIGANPFLTPCFYGAIFFAAAFVLSCLILRG